MFLTRAATRWWQITNVLFDVNTTTARLKRLSITRLLINDRKENEEEKNEEDKEQKFVFHFHFLSK